MEQQRETANLVVGDAHFGKETSTYNPDVFKERIVRLGDKLGRIRELLCAYGFDELCIHMIGDINDGSGIYPTQAHHQAETSAANQLFDSLQIWSPFLKGQADVWGKVRVETVPGNHGRTGLAAAEIDNWDVLFYAMLQQFVTDERVKVIREEKGDPFIRIVPVYDHRFLLYHGHMINAWTGIPWYGIQTRLTRWFTSESLPEWDVALIGHFHTCGMWTFNRLRVLCNGTMVTNDDWALQKMGWESSPVWWLFGSSPTRAITWMFPVDLA